MKLRRIFLLFFAFFVFHTMSFGQLQEVAGFWKGKFSCPKTGEEIEIELQLATSPKDKDKDCVKGNILMKKPTSKNRA